MTDSLPEQPAFMSTQELADLAEVTVPTVTRWVADNRLRPCFKGKGLRGAYVFQKSEVERFLTVRNRQLAE